MRNKERNQGSEKQKSRRITGKENGQEKVEAKWYRV